MMDVKPWYLSKTIWSSLIAVLAAVLAAVGFEIDGAVQADLVELALQTVTVGASLFAVFGRLVATAEIE